MNRNNRARKIFAKRGLGLATMVFIALMAKTAQAQMDFFTTAGAINDGANNSFVFNVSGLDDSTTDVNLTLNLAHPWVGDLNIYLFSPTGQSIMLFNGNGISGVDFTDTVFTDTAASSITTGSAPYTDSFWADGNLLTWNDNGSDFTASIDTLSGFFGYDPNGDWTLQINDTAAGDAGDLLVITKLTLTAAPSVGGSGVTAPEPGTLGLLTLGMSAGSGAILRRRKK
jgi:subtilisin-like proprotein convertase family protein